MSQYTLAEFTAMLRRSILNDPVGTKWDDAAVLDYLNWSLDTLCAHTALPSTMTIADGDAKDGGGTWDLSTDTVFTLPSDLYEGADVSTTGRVYIVNSTRVTYLDPVQYTPGMTLANRNGFTEWPQGTLSLGEAPGTGTTLYVNYFAYYPHPTEDTDLIAAPQWSITAISYLCGAHALAKYGMRAADIRQWIDKDDRGNPEDNPLRAQQEWFIRRYEYEISRHPKQDRSNFFRGMS